MQSRVKEELSFLKLLLQPSLLSLTIRRHILSTLCTSRHSRGRFKKRDNKQGACRFTFCNFRCSIACCQAVLTRCSKLYNFQCNQTFAEWTCSVGSIWQLRFARCFALYNAHVHVATHTCMLPPGRGTLASLGASPKSCLQGRHGLKLCCILKAFFVY